MWLLTSDIFGRRCSETVTASNFQKADWSLYKKIVNDLANHLPCPDIENINEAYKRFTNALEIAGKRAVPTGFRKKCSPSWDNDCNVPYVKYKEATASEDIQDAATALMDHIEKKQERWMEAVSSIDFKHSSRKAWQRINLLTGCTRKKIRCLIDPNAIAKHIVQNGCFVQQFVQNHLGVPFTKTELEAALMTTQPRKAKGPNGVPNEILTNRGEALLNWLLSFVKACLANLIPKMWRRVSVVAILKPGKPRSSPNIYRKISLLCSSFKLFERFILNRINPIIDPLLPTEQVGFRKYRSTAHQVCRLTQNIE